VIAIINYGSGNVQAIARIYRRLNLPVVLATTAREVLEADRLILPGVGAFDWAMQRLNDSGMRAALEHCVLEEKKPLLGICVGMQMLARSSEEGTLAGLGWIAGAVKRFDAAGSARAMQLPHMGWNDVAARAGSGLFDGFGSDARFYFLHSYYFLPDDQQDILAITDYHGRFVSSVRCANVHGVQFHPEKSHQWGITLLRNFAEL
jgi:glutamine amidotransferase